jgi:hypothetical protein
MSEMNHRQNDGPEMGEIMVILITVTSLAALLIAVLVLPKEDTHQSSLPTEWERPRQIEKER